MSIHSYRPTSYPLIVIDPDVSPLKLYVDYEPSSYSQTTSTFVDSGRNTKGKVVGSVIRHNVSSIEIHWKVLDLTTWSRINLKFKNKFYHEVEFHDQVIGGMRRTKMYVSDRTASIGRLDPTDGTPLYYVDCSLTLVEV